MKIRHLVMTVTATLVAAFGVSSFADAAKVHKTAKHASKHAAKKSSGTATTPADSTTDSANEQADGDHHGGPPNETELTGTELKQASDAATAAAGGGTVERASKEDTADTSGAIYEVHVTKADGTEVEVLEDAGFKVTATRAGHQHGGHDGDHGGPGDNDAPAATGKGTGA